MKWRWWYVIFMIGFLLSITIGNTIKISRLNSRIEKLETFPKATLQKATRDNENNYDSFSLMVWSTNTDIVKGDILYTHTIDGTKHLFLYTGKE